MLQKKKMGMKWYIASHILTLFVTALTVYFCHDWWLSKIEWTDCGNSVETALDRGCHYDMMMGAWLPAACYDPELSNEWLVTEEGRWFHDKNFTEPWAVADIRKGLHHSALTRPDYHYKHCAYMWVRLLKGIQRGQMLDTDAISLGHAAHCSKFLSEPTKLEELGPFTRLNVGYPKCGRPRRSGWQRMIQSGE